MNRWEIWLATVNYEDNPAISKHRPVLVVAPGKYYILSLKITSHAPRENARLEYALQKWKEAGLSKPSTVRISKRLKLNQSDFVHKIGRLHPTDILSIQNMI